MEFNQQESNPNSIVSYHESLITLSHKKLKTPCYISQINAHEVLIHSLDDIDKELLFKITCQNPIDLLIIGTGERVRFLTPKQQASISKLGMGVECMNNSSACSSFNLLLSDARVVGLLIL